MEFLGGQRLIDRVLNTLAPLGEIIVVVAQGKSLPLPPGIKKIEDIYPDMASLGGIYTGLKASSTFHSLVVACDMPFLNPSLLRYLVSLSPGFDIVIPKLKGYLEPLHAVYSKNCIPHMEALIKQGDLKITNFFPQVKVRYVEEEEIARFDPQLLSFFNINTFEDLEKAKRLIEGDL